VIGRSDPPAGYKEELSFVTYVTKDSFFFKAKRTAAFAGCLKQAALFFNSM
jgi:hypothetical protein